MIDQKSTQLKCAGYEIWNHNQLMQISVCNYEATPVMLW